MVRFKKIRRLVAVLVVIAVALTVLTPLQAAAQENSFYDENPFHDIENTDVYYEAVLYCYANGIVNGMNEVRFAPDETLTRAMFVTMLGRVAGNMGLKTSGYSSSFLDVEKDSWYESYVGWAYKFNIVNGMSSTRFAPEECITREQAAAIVVRFTTSFGLKLSASSGADLVDRAYVSDWAKPSMNSAIAAGLAIGLDEGMLRPQANATRAETVVMLHTLCERYIGDTKLFYIFGDYVKADKQLPVNDYIGENFQKDGSFRFYQDDNFVSMQGVDVSSHQSEIDWAKVRAAGIEFAMLRVGGRGYGVQTGGYIYSDAQFENNIRGALENDVKVGVYFFSQAVSIAEALEEAEYVLSTIEGYDVAFPVVYDWENISNARARTDNLSSEILTDCAIAFCETVAAAGYKPMVYFNLYISTKLYDLGRLAEYDFWLAEYKDVPEFYYDFKIWQYTDKGKVDGISGHVDMNISFVDYSV